MTKEEIEGNKLIAKFYGLLFSKSGKSVRKKKNGSPFKPTAIKYHTSWDWLMPVVEKIRDTPMIEGKVLAQTNKWEGICNWLMVADKDRIWVSVVEFIKWYNLQSK